MIKFKKIPPTPLDWKDSELRLPCVILIDTSASMIMVKDELHKGLGALLKTLDALALRRLDICLVGFGDGAKVIVPFSPAFGLEIPDFECCGEAVINSAIKMGLSELETQKNQYKTYYTSYYRPWIFMLTSGNVDDDDFDTMRKDDLLQAQKSGACRFLSICISSDHNKDVLRSLNIDGIYLTTESFQQACEWIGNSLNCISRLSYQRNVVLPNPNDYDLELHY